MFDGDEMTEEEFQDQPDKEFVITQDMVYELIRQNVEIPEGQDIDWGNLYVK